MHISFFFFLPPLLSLSLVRTPDVLHLSRRVQQRFTTAYINVLQGNKGKSVQLRHFISGNIRYLCKMELLMHVRRIYRSRAIIFLLFRRQLFAGRVGVTWWIWSEEERERGRERWRTRKRRTLTTRIFLLSLLFYFLFRASCLYLLHPSTFHVICLYTVSKLLLYGYLDVQGVSNFKHSIYSIICSKSDVEIVAYNIKLEWQIIYLI